MAASSVLVNFAFLCLCVACASAGGIYLIIPSKCEPLRGEECIEIRKCPFFDDLLNKTTIPRPKWVIDIIRKRQCAIIRNTPFVCCNKTIPEQEPEPEDKSDSLPIYEELTNAFSRHENYRLLPNDICGPTRMDSRITSGTKAALNEFPWMALIAYNTTEEGIVFKCGGTVINERYVLTAAHCIFKAAVGVRLGEHNLQTTKDCDSEENYCSPPTQDFYIEEVIVHPDYNSSTYINDIALIRLATPADFSFSNVQPICLPFSDMDSNDKSVIVSGWGVTETGFNSPELMKASIPVLPVSECQRKYKQFVPVTSKQICAGGYKGKDTCKGDSGGPLKYVRTIDGAPRYIQYGIVSYGPQYCGANGQPGVYTRVFAYINWILDNLKPGEGD